jgi:hypothetical protein
VMYWFVTFVTEVSLYSPRRMPEKTPRKLWGLVEAPVGVRHFLQQQYKVETATRRKHLSSTKVEILSLSDRQSS